MLVKHFIYSNEMKDIVCVNEDPQSPTCGHGWLNYNIYFLQRHQRSSLLLMGNYRRLIVTTFVYLQCYFWISVMNWSKWCFLEPLCRSTRRHEHANRRFCHHCETEHLMLILPPEMTRRRATGLSCLVKEQGRWVRN